MQTTHQATDAALIHAFIHGDESALKCLINRHKDRIYTAIYVLVKDKYTAEDLFQDSFLKIIKTMREGRYCEQGKFLPWALRVAHNLCMDYFRRVRPFVPVTTADGEDIFNFLPCPSDNAPERIIRRQVNGSVRRLVEQLSEEQREVVVLRMYGDLSFKEIAGLTNVSINTALGRMRYALINLRKSIQEHHLALR